MMCQRRRSKDRKENPTGVGFKRRGAGENSLHMSARFLRNFGAKELALKELGFGYGFSIEEPTRSRPDHGPIRTRPSSYP